MGKVDKIQKGISNEHKLMHIGGSSGNNGFKNKN